MLAFLLLTKIPNGFYTPDADFNGSDSFSYTINDGNGGTDTATVTVTIEGVNDTPTTADNTLTTEEDTDRAFVIADFNFSDVDSGDTLQEVRIETLPTEGILYLDANGNSLVDVDEEITVGESVSVSAIDAGQFKFKPDSDENGTPYTDFTFSVSDGIDFSVDSATITVEVTPVNDTPTTSDNTLTTEEDTDRAFVAADFNFSDVDSGDTLQEVRIETLPAEGILYLDANGNSLVDTDEAVAAGESISVSAINAGEFKFKPDLDEKGTPYTNFTFSVSNGIAFSNVATMTLNVTPSNIIQPVSYEMLNGETGSYQYWDENYTGAGQTTVDLSPLTGGLGDLTNGSIATENWNVVEAPLGSGPYVGWRNIDPTITFNFDSTVTIDTLSIYVDDSNGLGAVRTPASAIISMGGTILNRPIVDPPGSDPILVTFSDLGLTGTSLDLTLNRQSGSWVFLSEVTFESGILQPTVSIVPATLSLNEGDSGTTAYTFKVSLSEASTGLITVPYTVDDGSATVADNDYLDNDGTLTFNPGELTQPLTVEVNGDNIPENNENFFVGLGTPSGATLDPSASESQGFILDDDANAGFLEFSTGSFSVLEADEVAQITIVRTGGDDGEVSATLTLNDGTATAPDDYNNAPITVTLEDGQNAEVVSIPIVNDGLFEADDETINLQLENPLGGVGLGTQDTAVLSILGDGPQPRFSINDVTVVEGDDTNPTALFTVTLSGEITDSVTVDFATTSGPGGRAKSDEDFLATSGTLTFTPDTKTQTIPVEVVGDINAERDEVFFVNLSNASDGVTIADGQGTGQIEDDADGLVISDVELLEGDSGTTIAQFSVTPSDPISSPVEVFFTTENISTLSGFARANSDYVPTTGFLTIPFRLLLQSAARSHSKRHLS